MFARASIRHSPGLALLVGMACLLLGRNACAHTMNLFAYVEGGEIRGQVFARGGTPLVGIPVTAFAPKGEILAETTTNDQGEFALSPTRRCPWRLVAVADNGHEAQYTVPLDELPPDLPDSGETPAPTALLPDDAAVLVPISHKSIRTFGSAPEDGATTELSRQVTAMRREINQLRDESRWQDLIGGIGYILGLMGLSFYFLGVRRRDRDRPTTEI